ncbi:hypothetical protein [Tropicibacter oceani]|uniref:Uncharacterized protein n=1 Tax=Tropicibacter oceani TaxID=3058420 RepID=A0ABY8QDJ0_9RHOB|nr:hypothetical protein [Tropicibacter oceani]WGW02690.1 hypothetical protein QF118_12155 [Tropicibacter oceani]
MKPMTTLALATTLAFGTATFVQASHANPWATAEDTVLEKYHDDNQSKSTGTPGQDEMRGVMKRSAHGKTSGIASDNSGQGGSGGQGGGQGGGRGGKR